MKNYFGLEEGEPITPEMIDYARRHYISDKKFDNHMDAFFDLIEYLPLERKKGFINWGSNNSFSIALPLTLGTAYELINSNNNERRIQF